MPISAQHDRFSTKKHAFVVLLCMMVSVGLCVSAPLLTYGSTLALFGTAHVLCELRFIDQRFGMRIGRRYGCLLGVLLVSVVIIRVLLLSKWLPVVELYQAEIVVIALLALSPLLIPGKDFLSKLLTLLVGCSMVLGFFVSPALTLLILTLLHNLTPMGFIVEVAPGSLKTRAFLLCVIAFLGIPIAISLGLMHLLLEPIVGFHQNLTFLPTGPLEKQLGIFLPAFFTTAPWAVHAFSAVVFAQCMHYVAVIYVMPLLITRFSPENDIKPLMAWPKNALFWLMVALVTCVLLVFYWGDFARARAIYGIAAAVHAYVEIPILLLALNLTAKSAKQVPLQRATRHSLSMR